MEYMKTFGSSDFSIELTLFEQPMEHNVIGLLTSKLFENPMGLVQKEKAKPDEEFCPAYLGIVHKNHGFVLMDKSLINALKQGNRMAEMVMLHEIGHYLHGDYRDNPVKDCDAECLQALQQGKVSHKELEADAFAAEYLGEKTTALALNDLKNYFIRNFQSCDIWNKSDVENVINELEIRIEWLKHKGAI